MAHDLQGAAIVMRQYGGPDVLRQEIVSIPSLRPDEIRIRSIGSAVNHSDLEIRAGNWPILTSDPFPYTPGLEVVGEVVDAGAAVSDIRIGDRVITMMQGLGGVRPRRPGGYAEYVTVAAVAAATFSASVDPLDMAALGLGSVTAFEALQKIGDLKDRRIAVAGAAGGVGSAAVAIARARGAEVVGIVSRPEHAEYVRALGASRTITPQDVAAGALAPETIDGVLDTVGGKSFASCVEALRPGGVLSLVGAVGGSNVSFDAYRLLEVTLTGYASDTLGWRRLAPRHTIHIRLAERRSDTGAGPQRVSIGGRRRGTRETGAACGPGTRRLDTSALALFVVTCRLLPGHVAARCRLWRPRACARPQRRSDIRKSSLSLLATRMLPPSTARTPANCRFFGSDDLRQIRQADDAQH